MNDITVEELKKRMQAGESLNILDVREDWEYEEFNIGAKLIPLGDLPNRIAEIENLKNQELIVHCKAGGRSANAQHFLQSQGFTQVRNLLGGMMAYQS